jgi:DNA-binding response OmpR family regulator
MEEIKLKVLVVEDELEIRTLILDHLQSCGISATGLDSGKDILVHLENFQPHVVLLDQMMPGKSGQEIVQEIRSHGKRGQTPIMMVTGVVNEEQKISALEVGADDYLTKPFSMKELVARIQALVRRANSAQLQNHKQIVLKDLQIDIGAHKVHVSGAEIQLTLTEYKILHDLALQPSLVVSRDDLRAKALCNLNISDRTIDVHMASLRKKLGTLGDSVETVRGIGYRLAL